MNQIQVNPQFHKRVEACIRRVGKFLTFYKTPTQFIDVDTGEFKEPEIKAWIKLIAETVNGKIDGALIEEAFDGRVKEIIAAVAKSYKGRDWPMPHHFEQAAQEVAKRYSVSQPKPQSTGIAADRSVAIWAERMRREEPVADIYTVPPLSTIMVENFGVSPELIERYQKTLYVDMITLYGQELGQQKWDDLVSGQAKLADDQNDQHTPARSDERRKAVAAALQAFQPAR